MTLTDGQVWNAIDRAKRAFRSAETKANRKAQRAMQRAIERYDARYDLEKASRENAIARAEAIQHIELETALVKYVDKLEAVRANAGEWADLVPVVRVKR